MSHQSDSIYKIYGFFPTPPEVSELMFEMLGEIESDDVVLEPSAGAGDIADQIARYTKNIVVVESNRSLQEILSAKGYDVHDMTFEEFDTETHFDKVVMNPPFADAADMLHIQKAFSLLKQKGKLVAILGLNPKDHTREQRDDFLNWVRTSPEISDYRLTKVCPSLFAQEKNPKKSFVPMEFLFLEKG